MSISSQLQNIWNELPDRTRLVAVSKFHPPEMINEAYLTGQRIFGESKVQELNAKQVVLPQDIEWHFIGHLQTNKVKYIASFIDTIHSIDGLKLLQEVNKHAFNNNRKINVLLQIHIAEEDTKFGFTYEECKQFIENVPLAEYKNVTITGIMGMATFTDNMAQLRREYAGLRSFFQDIKASYFADDINFRELSMGMSDDYKIAIDEGSTMIRVGSKIFGSRV